MAAEEGSPGAPTAEQAEQVRGVIEAGAEAAQGKTGEEAQTAAVDAIRAELKNLKIEMPPEAIQEIARLSSKMTVEEIRAAGGFEEAPTAPPAPASAEQPAAEQPGPPAAEAPAEAPRKRSLAERYAGL